MHLTLWRDLLQLLEGSLSREAIALWILPIKPLLVSREKLVLEVPNGLHERIVRERYLAVIRRCARALTGAAMEVDFVRSSDNGSPVAPPGRLAAPPARGRANAVGLNPAYTFQGFVVGSCNRAAYHAAVAAADRPGKKRNPLFITGGVGLGKTHLLQAIGARAASGEKHAFVYTPSDLLMDELMEAVQGRTIARVRKRLSSVSILLVDDIHSLGGKNQVQEEFFSLFTAILGNGGQVVLSSDRPPKEIPRLHQRLVSRFESGTMMELKQPALATRLAILERKARLLGITLPRSVLMLLASEIRSNIRRMEGAVNRLAAQASIGGGIPGREAVDALLRDQLFGGDAQCVTTRGIQQRVASHFQIRLGALLGPARSGRVAFPRQLAMYLCRRLVNSPYADIGAAFSGRDHTTVMHACKTIEDLLRGNGDARDTVDQLITALRS
ncbi:MAG: chromosomal replication initiator protein DnaA [Chlamydiota bacterium]